MRIKLILSLFILALFAPAAWAADGDPCPIDSITRRSYIGGMCVIMCDSKTGNGSCADIAQIRNGTFTIEIHKQTGCSACSVDVNWTSETGLDEHDVVTLTCTGTTAHTVGAAVSAPGFITAEVSSTAGPCTDLDVYAHFE